MCYLSLFLYSYTPANAIRKRNIDFYFVSEAPKFENLFFFVFFSLITLLKSSDFSGLDYISSHNG